MWKNRKKITVAKRLQKGSMNCGCGPRMDNGSGCDKYVDKCHEEKHDKK